MGKRQNRNKPSRTRIKTQVVSDVEYVIHAAPTPVDPNAPPKMKRLYRAMLEDPEAGFAEEVIRLAALVRSTDPLFLLAEMSMHLTCPPKTGPATMRVLTGVDLP